MTVGVTGDWRGGGRLLAGAGSPVVWRRAKRQAVLKEAHRLRGIMVRSFNAGGPPGKRWKRLSAFTQLVSRAQGKGDRRPLMDTADLRNSHSVVEEGETVFVGVHRTAKGKRGQPLVNIAIVHEHGATATLRVTPKMRAWFIAMSKKSRGQIKPLRKSTTVIVVRVPARSWIGPIWDAEADNAAMNIMRDTVKGLGIPGISALVR